MKINLQKEIEDYFDSLKALQLENDPEEDGISLEELIKKYQNINDSSKKTIKL